VSDISVYLLSIVGVVVLSVILDLVLPGGQISKYIKGIMSVVIVFVIASPLPGIVKNGLSFSYTFNETTVSSNYAETIKTQNILMAKKMLELELEKEGFAGTKLEIWGDMENGKLKISHIFVDLQNLVLTTKDEHINKYEAIKNLLVKKTGIKQEQVIIDG